MLDAEETSAERCEKRPNESPQMRLPSPASRPAAGIAALSMFAAIAVAWLPWVRTGSRTRNSYEVFRSAQRLGLEELTPLRVLWFVIPVIAAAAVLAGVANQTRVFGLLAAFVGVTVAIAGLLVAISGAGAGSAPLLAVAVGLAAMVSGVLLVRNPQGPSLV